MSQFIFGESKKKKQSDSLTNDSYKQFQVQTKSQTIDAYEPVLFSVRQIHPKQPPVYPM